MNSATGGPPGIPMTKAEDESGARQVQAHPVQAPELQGQARVVVFGTLAQAQAQGGQDGQQQHQQRMVGEAVEQGGNGQEVDPPGGHRQQRKTQQAQARAVGAQQLQMTALAPQ